MKRPLWICIVFAIASLSIGCADKCEQTAENHCQRYSDEELKDMFGTNKDRTAALKECIEGRIQEKCTEK